MRRPSLNARPLIALALVAVLWGVTACTSQEPGRGRLYLRPVAKVQNAKQLATLLVSPPQGSDPGTSDWAQKRTPTVRQLAAQTFKDVDAGEKILDGYDIKGIAHVVWTAQDGTGADMMLLLFEDDAAAQKWKNTEVDDFGTEGLDKRTLTAGTDTVGFSFDPDDDGVTDTRFHTVAENVGVLMDYFEPKSYDDTDANTWLSQQYDRLT